MTLVLYFLAGFFAWNSIPHLVKGITGQTHMTPFKKVSSPELNVVWSFINVVITLFLLSKASGSDAWLTLPWNAGLAGTNLWAFLAGALVVGVYLAHFWSNPKAKLPWQ